MDELNIENKWTSLQDMQFSNEFDKYVYYLEQKRREIDDLIN